MKRDLVLLAAIATGLLAFAVNAGAAPIYPTFLQVDVNGDGGPTQTSWDPWAIVRTPATNTFNNAFGAVSVKLTAVSFSSTLPQSRNRGGPSGGNDVYLSNVYKDFVYIPHSSNAGLGMDYLELEFSGLAAGQYEFTMFSYDEAHDNAALKYMAWSDEATIGYNGPAAYLTNNGYATGYPPTNDNPDPGTYKNPVPLPMKSDGSGIARTSMAGPWPSDPAIQNAYQYATSILVSSDGVNPVRLYGWADLDAYTGTQHAPLNGFSIGRVPEPTSIALFGLGFGVLLIGRRKGRATA